jgi:hypothetical protein
MKTKHKLCSYGLFVMLSTSACASTETAAVNEASIELDVQRCVVATKNNIKLNLSMKPLCGFMKLSNSDKVMVKYYNDIKSHVIVVVGTSATNIPDFPITATRKDCGSQLQAVIISDKKLSVSTKILSDMITCAGTGVDEKVYWMLSH